MPEPVKLVNVTVSDQHVFQRIDGFGVNINSKYWDNAGLLPVMDLLVDDLGAVLYRVDIWGKSDWPDPDGTKGPSSLDPENLNKIYSGPVFSDGWTMMRHLNSRGIEPYLTVSGDVPKWMLYRDGKTLKEYGLFCDMLVSLLERAVRKEKIKFKLFGPMNETDIGQPEGPLVSPVEYAKVLSLLHEKLSAKGLNDIRFVVAEQAYCNTNYIKAITGIPGLADRIGAFGLHQYGPIEKKVYEEVVNIAGQAGFASVPVWMTEYGDLDQSGEREWYVAWNSTDRLLSLLEGGFNGAMVWDAFDNYHDHDGAWTIYGLLRAARKIYTPKKRYFAARQVYRFVRPGFQKIETGTDCEGIKVISFASPDRKKLAVVGMNGLEESICLNLKPEGGLSGLLKERMMFFKTTEKDNCAGERVTDVYPGQWPFDGKVVHLPAKSVFTITNVD